MAKSQPIAVVFSDVHLRYSAPVARSPEPSWGAVLRRHIHRIAEVANSFRVPTFIAGDVFHRWDTLPVAVNMALQAFKEFQYPLYAIPGQHDMPNHRAADLHRSAYMTCHEAGVYQHLEEPLTYTVGGVPTMGGVSVCVYPFGWGEDVVPCSRKGEGVNIALVHHSIYQTKEHAGVADADLLEGWKGRLKGYTFAVFGDNHKGFITNSGKCTVVNCGGMVPTNKDQMNTRTGFAVLYGDGTAKRVSFDTSEDLWASQDVPIVDAAEKEAMRGILSALAEFAEMDLSYPDCVRQCMKASSSLLPEGTEEYIHEVLGVCNDSK